MFTFLIDINNDMAYKHNNIRHAYWKLLVFKFLLSVPDNFFSLFT
jgi:hypothetical protein